jgi:hypothetical protein
MPEFAVFILSDTLIDPSASWLQLRMRTLERRVRFGGRRRDDELNRSGRETGCDVNDLPERRPGAYRFAMVIPHPSLSQALFCSPGRGGGLTSPRFRQRIGEESLNDRTELGCGREVVVAVAHTMASRALFVAPRLHARVRCPLDAGHDFQGQLIVSVAHRAPERDPGHVLDQD